MCLEVFVGDFFLTAIGASVLNEVSTVGFDHSFLVVLVSCSHGEWPALDHDAISASFLVWPLTAAVIANL